MFQVKDWERERDREKLREGKSCGRTLLYSRSLEGISGLANEVIPNLVSCSRLYRGLNKKVEHNFEPNID